MLTQSASRANVDFAKTRVAEAFFALDASRHFALVRGANRVGTVGIHEKLSFDFLLSIVYRGGNASLILILELEVFTNKAVKKLFRSLSQIKT